MIDEVALAVRIERMRPLLNERQWRLYLGGEAESLGRGGIAAVARVSGASPNTVRRGMTDHEWAGDFPAGRVRAMGAGRPSAEAAQPGVTAQVEAIVDPETRGDPERPLRWTTKSLKKITESLAGLGYRISHTKVAEILHDRGYSLQAPFKTKEGASHPDRDAQFGYINDTVAAALAEGCPVVSMDCKKKELVGEYTQAGREWQPKANPVRVNGHDFPAGVPKAIPYGIYDIGANTGWVSVGIDHETADFAVNTLRMWWRLDGAESYTGAEHLVICVDAGGSNSYRSRAWKTALAVFAAETGLTITVLHYPPGTSKWNKIEHRLFSFISKNWRGRPLVNYQTVLDCIANTTTEQGLTVTAWLDESEYPTGLKISDTELAAVPLAPHDFHGEWNYTISHKLSATTRNPSKHDNISIK